MKKIILLFVLSGLSLVTHSQNYYWAKGAPSNGVSEGWANCLDGSGNLYVAGPFDGSSITFGTYTLTNSAFINSFLVKYDLNGNVIWARSDGGANNDYHYAVDTDPSGNIFVAGYFDSPTMVLGTFTLTNAGGADIYLIKYDPNGNVLWAKSAGSFSNDNALSVSADGAGNAFIGGTFSSPTLAIGSTTLTCTGGRGAFIAKYDGNGNPLWAKASSGAAGKLDQGLAVTTDVSGNTYLTGSFESPVLTLGTYTLSNIGNYNMFLGKYDTNGNVVWARSATLSNSADRTQGIGITSDPSGNIYVTGDYDGTGVKYGSITMTNPGGGSDFLTKYDTNGNVIWVRSAGGFGGHMGFSVSTYSAGIYLISAVQGSVTVLGTYTLSTPTNSFDPMYIVEYDLNGNVKCADVLPSGGDDQSGLSIDQYGNAYISGDYALNPPVFVLGTTTLTGTGSEEFFLTKFNCLAGVGIEVLNKNEGTDIYPNPNNGVFNLKIGNELSNAELILFNCLGQKVHEQKIEHGINSINIPELSKGIYNYILLQDKQRTGNGKLIVE